MDIGIDTENDAFYAGIGRGETQGDDPMMSALSENDIDKASSFLTVSDFQEYQSDEEPKVEQKAKQTKTKKSEGTKKRKTESEGSAVKPKKKKSKKLTVKDFLNEDVEVEDDDEGEDIGDSEPDDRPNEYEKGDFVVSDDEDDDGEEGGEEGLSGLALYNAVNAKLEKERPVKTTKMEITKRIPVRKEVDPNTLGALNTLKFLQTTKGARDLSTNVIIKEFVDKMKDLIIKLKEKNGLMKGGKNVAIVCSPVTIRAVLEMICQCAIKSIVGDIGKLKNEIDSCTTKIEQWKEAKEFITKAKDDIQNLDNTLEKFVETIIKDTQTSIGNDYVLPAWGIIGLAPSCKAFIKTEIRTKDKPVICGVTGKRIEPDSQAYCLLVRHTNNKNDDEISTFFISKREKADSLENIYLQKCLSFFHMACFRQIIKVYIDKWIKNNHVSSSESELDLLVKLLKGQDTPVFDIILDFLLTYNVMRTENTTN